MPAHYLIKHVGNMGDLVFFVPPVLEVLKRRDPACHITLVTAWGFKDTRGQWGKRNMGGFCIHLMLTNPHVDQLIHWHDTKLALDGSFCREEGRRIPTWNAAHYATQKNSGAYDEVFELDFGIATDDNPIHRMFQAITLPEEDYSHYRLYFSDSDRQVAQAVTHDWPRPRIVLLEGLESPTTRGWDPDKIPALIEKITAAYGVAPLWFGSKYVPDYQGRPLTLRENIATLIECDVAIGVPSGPLHFAAAVGTPTLTLYADQPLHRAAPAYFLNPYIKTSQKQHRTLLGPTARPYAFLKNDQASINLTPQEAARQGGYDWQHPGAQATKTGLAVITVDEVLQVLGIMLPPAAARA